MLRVKWKSTPAPATPAISPPRMKAGLGPGPRTKYLVALSRRVEGRAGQWGWHRGARHRRKGRTGGKREQSAPVLKRAYGAQGLHRAHLCGHGELR